MTGRLSEGARGAWKRESAVEAVRCGVSRSTKRGAGQGRSFLFAISNRAHSLFLTFGKCVVLSPKNVCSCVARKKWRAWGGGSAPLSKKKKSKAHNSSCTYRGGDTLRNRRAERGEVHVLQCHQTSVKWQLCFLLILEWSERTGDPPNKSRFS